MPWRDGEVLADLERPPVDLRWNGPALDDVAEEILEAVQQAFAVGLGPLASARRDYPTGS